ncbi:hypothetical protein K8Q98_02025 [Candidatus Nomurabacteria bacterium]|nr:hypothetical protein [Candidatus Nomurabacteria bacterium]
METFSEPHSQKSSCPYCGDAPINHKLFYFASLFSTKIDSHIVKVTKHAPNFLRDFVDFLLVIFFKILLFFRIVKLSDDINKAKTFRSRVVWEEARKRGIDMKQLMMLGSPMDEYVATINGNPFYFNSLPIPTNLLVMKRNWDDKFILKEELSKKNIPVPSYLQFSAILSGNVENIFYKLQKPVIIKPQMGSRGRHTMTNIHTLEQFQEGVNIAKQICGYLVAEEHLHGDVCRATFVNGELMGFYKGSAPHVIGDGVKTIQELVLEKDAKRPERVEKVSLNKEIQEHINRSGFKVNDVLPYGLRLQLTHRTGRLFGGVTKEMLDELHPSFLPILREAAQIVDLPVIGFDCVVPDPTKEQNTQRWGIIECNTLPFIDLHYYALEGKPKNIAGKIWDLWS